MKYTTYTQYSYIHSDTSIALFKNLPNEDAKAVVTQDTDTH